MIQATRNRSAFPADGAAFAALVRASDTQHLQADVFYFGTSLRRLEAGLYLLKPGRYQATLTAVESGRVLMTRSLTITGNDDSLSLEIPSRILCRLVIERLKD